MAGLKFYERFAGHSVYSGHEYSLTWKPVREEDMEGLQFLNKTNKSTAIKIVVT